MATFRRARPRVHDASTARPRLDLLIIRPSSHTWPGTLEGC
jgi:hypothetical protein